LLHEALWTELQLDDANAVKAVALDILRAA
jgi:hypothetical protein